MPEFRRKGIFMQIPRNEYPKPQFERANWLNLNGEWQFETDNGRSGIERKLFEDSVTLKDRILVPFCPESKLSGIENKEFMYGVWYKRSFVLTKDQIKEKTILHFGAVDYKCTAYINGKEAGVHKGGYISFSFDISSLVKEGENIITVYAEDDTRSSMIPSGKQSHFFNSFGCFYTRTTGIWQTVWLEFHPEAYIKSVKFYPDARKGAITVSAELCGNGRFSAKTSFEGRATGDYAAENVGGTHSFTIQLSEKQLWEIGHGRLYDIEFAFENDSVKSYFGLRDVHLDGHKFMLNDKSIFQRLVLDQGFYPDGIYTAPTDTALENDILLSLAAGFNGARLHEKIFEERFLYYCDKHGYIVWGEYPDWGLDVPDPLSIYPITFEWLEEINRDFNHPAIIGWCPRNETGDRGEPYNDAVKLLYQITKAADSTRPCIDTSGYRHVLTDIYDIHDYDQNPESFKEHYDQLVEKSELYNRNRQVEPYNGEACFISEYGGTAYATQGGGGYGTTAQTEDDFVQKVKGLTDALLDNKEMFGFCYTQLTDVEQEQNGIYNYDRTPKLDVSRIKAIMQRKAAIEDDN